jgi:pSer/pThr/pTyr-binding forkhead associated (FHA) protein
VIGGASGSDVHLDDPHLDPAHTRVTEAAGGALVEDLGEPGGTFVNHAELRVPTRMTAGDLLQIGVSVLKLREGADAPSEVVEGPPMPAPVPTRARHEVDELLDVRVKRMAHHAPLAVFVIVVWAVLLYLATARL